MTLLQSLGNCNISGIANPAVFALTHLQPAPDCLETQQMQAPWGWAVPNVPLPPVGGAMG